VIPGLRSLRSLTRGYYLPPLRGWLKATSRLDVWNGRSVWALGATQHVALWFNLMTREIKESDWKVFRRFHAIALERFCRRVIEEVRSATAECSDGYHDCYLEVFALMRRRDKEMARAFNDPRRSNAFILLANIKEEDLLTEEELMQFSEETREAIEVIANFRRA
jgi:hypothetical protein